MESNAVIVGYFRTLLPKMDRSSRQKINTKNNGLGVHFRSNGPNGHIENIPSNSSRMHVLLKLTRNFVQDRSK